ncbi:MAG: GBS Bsp-like repeat-containing protein [Clostridiales Family XIII bacterium]|jgi:N-acetylmuramoyl-L-alanine amidase/uncharacterized protein YegP (UPF0339 family)|nr:GBS Bsp-like repeat-containing protein [Clostridiales Family XIII bacterium]
MYYSNKKLTKLISIMLALFVLLATISTISPAYASDEPNDEVIVEDESLSEQQKPQDAQDSQDETQDSQGAGFDEDSEVLDQEADSVLPDDEDLYRLDPPEISDGISAMALNPYAGGPIILALDPGHDDFHAGARGHGLNEETLNVRVAYACKSALSGYDNLIIHMTRDISGACPYGSTGTSGNCNQKRIEAAKALGAHYLISFHFNSGSASASGAMVLPPNANYSTQAYLEGANLATNILSQLSKQGLANNGSYYRDYPQNGDAASVYPDGSVADYYQIVRESKKLGMTGIVIEHAFLSNPNDAAKLQQPGFVETLGIADAVGIVNALQLSNSNVNPLEIVDRNDFNRTFSVHLNSSWLYSNVKFKVWSESEGKSNATDYKGTLSAGFFYYANINTANHTGAGVYYVQAYSNGKKVGNQEKLRIRKSKAELSTPIVNGYHSKVSLSETISNAPSDFTGISYAVWSDKGGLDDLVWYKGSKTGSKWNADVKIKNHKTTGKYYVDVYAYINNYSVYIGGTTFNIKGNSASKLTVTDKGSGTYRVTLSGVKAPIGPKGVSKVQFPVWSKNNGQDDLVWYTAKLSAKGNYYANIKISNHKYDGGIYNIHAYVTGKNGVRTLVKETTKNVIVPPVDLASSISKNQKYVTLTAKNAGQRGKVTKVRYAVWSDKGGQNDLVWYDATKSGSNWVAKANITKHKTSGKYYADAYATIGGNSVHLGTKTFTIKKNTAESLKVVKKSSGVYQVTLSGVKAPNGPNAVAEVQIPIWSESNGQDDIVWYTAKKVSSGKYRVTLKVSNHKYVFGKYNIHAYVRGKDGVRNSVKTTTVDIKAPTVSFTKTISKNEKYVTITAKDIGARGPVKDVRFAVWSDKGGQDDLIWYKGTKSGSNWSAKVNISTHKTLGKYNVDVYATMGGSSNYVGGSTFSIVGPTATVTALSGGGNPKGTIAIQKIKPSKYVTKVEVAVWQRTDQSDLAWYSAVKVGSTYSILINPQNHKYHVGNYKADAYITSANGIKKFVGSAGVTFLDSDIDYDTNDLYKVMGTTSVTVQQMVKWYNKANVNGPYPSTELGKGGASDITAFATICYDEARDEGVRAEVLFAQIMKETGFLHYGGAVSIEQFNFGGLGAVDSNPSGSSAWFPNVRTGIRAQVQHLEAYGTTTPNLVHDLVDPRFHLVTPKGCARYVQWLGQKENPNGKGWATGEGYGYSLMEYILKLKAI